MSVAEHPHRSGNSFNLARLRRDLKPFRLRWFPRLRSTNDQAALLRKRGELFAPAVVLSGRQIAGRGRGSNTWWSTTGSLTVTFIFPIDEHLTPYHVPLIAGLAVRAAVVELTANDDVQLKWPNDLLFRGRKLAGLLCERVYKADLVGVGLNVNLDPRKAPRELRDRIASLSEICEAGLDMTSVLATVGRQLHRRLSHRHEQSFAAVVREYDRHHWLLGRRVTVIGDGQEPAITGKCEGLDEMGRLLLRSRRTLHRIVAGQVQAV